MTLFSVPNCRVSDSYMYSTSIANVIYLVASNKRFNIFAVIISSALHITTHAYVWDADGVIVFWMNLVFECLPECSNTLYSGMPATRRDAKYQYIDRHIWCSFIHVVSVTFKICK